MGTESCKQVSSRSSLEEPTAPNKGLSYTPVIDVNNSPPPNGIGVNVQSHKLADLCRACAVTKATAESYSSGL